MPCGRNPLHKAELFTCIVCTKGACPDCEQDTNLCFGCRLATKDLIALVMKSRDDELDEKRRLIVELREQLTFQNAEIQRLLERYEPSTLPPGLRFDTGIDMNGGEEGQHGTNRL